MLLSSSWPIRGRLASVIALMVVANASPANLLTNGSFELGSPAPLPPADPFLVVNTGDSTTLTGWTVGGAVGVDWIHTNYWQSQDGLFSLDLNALGAGSITQTFATTAGATYSLDYFLSMNPDTNNTFPVNRISTVTVVNSADSTLLGQTTHNVPFNSFNSSYTNMNWTAYGLSFTATGSQTTLTFASGNDYAGGFTLDNVSILETNPGNPNPIPAPAGLVLGLLGLGVAVRYRRRSAKPAV